MSAPEIPRIALVGRPNVGKSTLFNRICGRRKAITDARPGSTRDRNYAQSSWQGAAFELVDTGGLLLQTADPLLGPAAEQAKLAIKEADRVVFVVDARAGLLPDDGAIAQRLRRDGKSVIVAVNKVEKGGDEVLSDFTRLGFDTVMAISAEHGLGVGDLLDEVLRGLERAEIPEEDRPLRLALVGRPNVGKSSLLNRLLGQERAVVSAVPGTTRDAVDSLLVKDGKKYLFVDTAGIRRQRLLKEAVDHVSVVQSKRTIEHSDVALVLLSADEGLREMDAVIGGYVEEAGTGVVIAVNKWDLAEERKLTQKGFREEIQRHLKFLPWAPVVFLSAQTGRGLTALLKAAEKVQEQRLRRITTGELNRMLLRAQQAYAPKAEKGNADVKILYGAQIGVAPPRFSIALNHPVNLHFSYKRYLENQIREAFGFEGTPLVLKVRTRRH